jgi:hypothetical protein
MLLSRVFKFREKYKNIVEKIKKLQKTTTRGKFREKTKTIS